MNASIKIIWALTLALLGVSHASGQSAFDGMWIADPGTAQFSGNPTTFLIRDGKAQCKSCVPVITVPADGNAHPVTGNAYFNSVQVTLVDDRTLIRTTMRDGAVVAQSTITVSGDGRTAGLEFVDARASSTNPIVGRGTLIRVGKQKRHKGTHELSGSWMIQRYTSLSENALSMRIGMKASRIVVQTLSGQSYDVSLGGSEAPYRGDDCGSVAAWPLCLVGNAEAQRETCSHSTAHD